MHQGLPQPTRMPFKHALFQWCSAKLHPNCNQRYHSIKLDRPESAQELVRRIPELGLLLQALREVAPTPRDRHSRPGASRGVTSPSASTSRLTGQRLIRQPPLPALTFNLTLSPPPQLNFSYGGTTPTPASLTDHYSRNGTILSLTTISDEENDVPVHRPTREHSIISISSGSSSESRDTTLELAYPADPPPAGEIIDMTKPMRLVVWFNPASHLHLLDYSSVLGSIGFGTSRRGRLYLVKHAKWIQYDWSIPVPLARANTIIYIRSPGVSVGSPDKFLDMFL
ncbi:hypothetical protein B0H10DRAFT_1956555 [Mycena sp. CBHHK59/15]|nr:hypothetical protein B0H10DRAFT_1956555 [Mycena sp. CBHHK59/15]